MYTNIFLDVYSKKWSGKGFHIISYYRKFKTNRNLFYSIFMSCLYLLIPDVPENSAHSWRLVARDYHFTIWNRAEQRFKNSYRGYQDPRDMIEIGCQVWTYSYVSNSISFPKMTIACDKLRSVFYNSILLNVLMKRNMNQTFYDCIYDYLERNLFN